MRLKLDSNDYEEKLREIRAALNRIPKYMENPEFKKAIENTQRVAAALGNMVVAISQSEAVKAFGRLAEQLSNIKLPQLSEEAKEGLENYHYLSLCYDGERYHRFGIVPCDHLVDSMGAGDSYIAGFLTGIVDGLSIEGAMEKGAANATETLKYFGAW